MATNPFELLNLKPGFDLDATRVERAYLSLAAAVHPDRAGEDASASTAELNQARDILRDPERRANAYLGWLGGKTKEEDRSLPPGFLADVMELREQVEEATSSGDPASKQRYLDAALARRAAFVARVSALFGTSPPPLAELRRELNAWRYVERLIEQLGDAPA